MKCIIIDDEKVSGIVLKKYIAKTDFLELTDTFDNPVKAANSLVGKNDIDLIFLDIEMPEMSGLDILDATENLPQIIIVSGKDKYAIDAIAYEVTDYLLKPIQYPRFLKAANKAKENFDKRKKESSEDGIFVKNTSSSFVRILYSEIYWIEAMENYVNIHTEDEKHTIHFTMKAMKQKLPSFFMRVHRSYIVNLNKIMSLEDNMIIMKIKSETQAIPVAKSYKEEFMNKLNIISK
ncbi:MAG: LytTR family DNA-binding domain-containing protein [Bacteroidota bacterium]|nr:LytTR family DNA-binding domain-containing protein [Bacteroidota bacterium]